MLKLVFTRQSDGATYEMGDIASQVILAGSNSFPPERSTTTTSYSYSVDDGGYATYGKGDPRIMDVDFILRERWDSEKPLETLIQETASFFRLNIPEYLNTSGMVTKLKELEKFSVDMYTGDKAKSVRRLRGGSINVEVSATSALDDRSATCHVQFFFGDRNLYDAGGQGNGFSEAVLRPRFISGVYMQGQKWVEGGKPFQAASLPMETWLDSDNAKPSMQGVTISFDSIANVPVDVEFTGFLNQPTVFNTTNGSTLLVDRRVEFGDTIQCHSDGQVFLNGTLIKVGSSPLLMSVGRNTLYMTCINNDYDGGNAVIRLRAAY